MKNKKNIRCNECKKIFIKKIYGPITELVTKKKFNIYYCSTCGLYKSYKVPKKLDLFYPNTYRNFRGLNKFVLGSEVCLWEPELISWVVHKEILNVNKFFWLITKVDKLNKWFLEGWVIGGFILGKFLDMLQKGWGWIKSLA